MSKSWLLLFLIGITVFCYFNSFDNAFVWDDINNIVNNEKLNQSLGWGDIFLHPGDGFYRPFAFLTIRFDYWLWEKNVLGYHLTNLLFHLFNVILIFLLTTKLTNSSLSSFVTALLFAIHPVQTEAVTYISGRSDLICLFFIFSSFWFYLSSIQKIKGGNKLSLVLSLSLFILALLSKEVALIFPVLLLVYNLIFLSAPLGKKVRRVIPFFLISALFVIFRLFLLQGYQFTLSAGNPKNAFRIFLFYLKILIFPFNLHMQRFLAESYFLSPVSFILSVIIFIGFLMLILRYIKKKDLVFGLSWFLIGLVPFLGFLKLNADIAEHWLYFASFGFFLFVSQIRLWRNKIFLFIIILYLSSITVQQNFIWHDDLTIYQNTLKYRNDDPRLYYNLGNAYLRRDMLGLAENEYEIALKLKPNYAYALNNLGIIMEKRHKYEAALEFYKKAAIASPGFHIAKENIFRFHSTETALAQEISFDHSLYGEVLRKFVDEGKVNYVALKNNHSALDNYLRKIDELDMEALNSMSREEKIAFYINAYNAFTLKAIIDYYPVKSIKDIPGVWNKIKFKVAGRELSLNQIEHEILRKKLNEPRIHFALVCASKGCPKLSNKPFTAEGLNDQLDNAAQKFINDMRKVKLDKKKNILYLSSIFKWFRNDFGDVVKFVSHYLTPEDAKFIKERNPVIKYLRYDWSLNGQ